MMTYIHQIIHSSVDDLQVKGIELIRKLGWRLESSSHGPAIQVSNCNYILEPTNNSYDRVNSWRAPKTVKYFANELIFYFSGSTNVYDAIKASKFWLRMADDEGQIQSNYGNFVFYQKIGNSRGQSQYESCRNKLLQQPQSRRAVIQILGSAHDMFGSDFPCTFGMHFIIENSHLNCIVSSRSTDVIRGLPYDMGFFCLMNELLWNDLTEHGIEIQLGYTMMKSDLTQIYDRTNHLAEQVMQTALQNPRKPIWMPKINSAKELLIDIDKNLVSAGYRTGNVKSSLLKWCFENSK